MFRPVKSCLKCLPKPCSGRPRRNQPFRENPARAFVGIPTCLSCAYPSRIVAARNRLCKLITGRVILYRGQIAKTQINGRKLQFYQKWYLEKTFALMSCIIWNQKKIFDFLLHILSKTCVQYAVRFRDFRDFALSCGDYS